MRILSVVIVCFVASCAALQSGPKPTTAPEQSEDEESGVKGISRLLRESKRALAAKQFEDSNRLLRRAELSVQKASVVTRAHPDFEDLSAAVDRARVGLEEAIEADRIARRNAAIDDLMRRGEHKLDQGTSLYNELRARVPTAADVDALNEIVADLGRMRTDGEEYLDEPRYERHATERDEKATTLEKRRDQAAWQLHAAELVGSAVEAAYQAASRVHEGETTTELVASFRNAANGFMRCVNAISDLESEPQYNAAWLIETRLGVKTIGKTKKLCVERGARARKEADRREWDSRIAGIIEQIGPPVTEARSSKRAADALAATSDAVEALQLCQTELDAISRHPGASTSKTFESALGKVNAARLRQACVSEQARLVAAKPRLTWKTAFEDMMRQLEATKTGIEAGQSATDPQTRVEAWRGVVGGLEECVEQTRTLGGDKAADKGYAVKTPFGRFTVSLLEKDCRKRLGEAEKSLREANAAAELAEFIKGCSADEVGVAQREGIPDRIETVEGGRMFVYEAKVRKGRKEPRHFGFDHTGKRVDFRLRWLNTVGTVAGEVNRVLKDVQRAKSGEEALRTTKEALPVLEACVETLQATEKSPGYDAAAVFNTTLGKLPAAKLKHACSAEHAKRAKGLVGIEWRVRLEALRDRVDEAQAAIGRAAASKDISRKLDLIGSAIGGYTECTERIDPLGSEPGADKSLKATSAHGALNLRGFAKVCAKQLEQAKAALDEAMKQKEHQAFLETCRADEKAVARRQGMPTRVEQMGEGRVFVYDTKSRRKTKSKRFAFDANGKRVDERTLRHK